MIVLILVVGLLLCGAPWWAEEKPMIVLILVVGLLLCGAPWWAVEWANREADLDERDR